MLEEAALTEARELARTLADDADSLPTLCLLGWLHWYRYRALPEGRDRQDLQTAVTMCTSCFIKGMEDLPLPLLPFLADGAIPAATELPEPVAPTRSRARDPASPNSRHRILACQPVGAENYEGYSGRPVEVQADDC